MDVPRSVALFAVAAVAEIGGAWLIWQAVRAGRPWHWAVLGGLALVAYGFVATGQPESHFGRVLAAYGGVFVAASLVWGMSSTASGRTATTSSGPPSAWWASR